MGILNNMYKSQYEKLLRKMTKIGKKNTGLRIVMIVFMTMIISFHNSIFFITHNGRRFTVVACAVLCFFVNASFIDPQVNDDIQSIEDTLVFQSEAVALANNIGDEIIIDDNDVIEEDDEIENVYYDEDEVDTFTVEEILEENEAYIAENSSDAHIDDSEKEKLLAEYENYEFDESDWRYVLINKQHPIPDDYSFTLGTIKGNMQCDERILESLINMLQSAKEDGVNLVVCSPYRDYKKQQVLFERKINKYMAKGYSYLEAYKLTSQTVTVPGASEHQIGLAIDFISDNYRVLDEGFGESDAGIWLKEHSYEYGFILRYPEGKEYITGISYEPWHFRYIGTQAATVITMNEITLEEFTDEYLK